MLSFKAVITFVQSIYTNVQKHSLKSLNFSVLRVCYYDNIFFVTIIIVIYCNFYR